MCGYRLILGCLKGFVGRKCVKTLCIVSVYILYRHNVDNIQDKYLYFFKIPLLMALYAALL